jgi:hypothetical protein
MRTTTKVVSLLRARARRTAKFGIVPTASQRSPFIFAANEMHFTYTMRRVMATLSSRLCADSRLMRQFGHQIASNQSAGVLSKGLITY